MKAARRIKREQPIKRHNVIEPYNVKIRDVTTVVKLPSLLRYNFSLEDLMKIDPKIIGYGTRKLFTDEGWDRIRVMYGGDKW